MFVLAGALASLLLAITGRGSEIEAILNQDPIHPAAGRSPEYAMYIEQVVSGEATLDSCIINDNVFRQVGAYHNLVKTGQYGETYECADRIVASGIEGRSEHELELQKAFQQRQKRLATASIPLLENVIIYKGVPDSGCTFGRRNVRSDLVLVMPVSIDETCMIGLLDTGANVSLVGEGGGVPFAQPETRPLGRLGNVRLGGSSFSGLPAMTLNKEIWSGISRSGADVVLGLDVLSHLEVSVHESGTSVRSYRRSERPSDQTRLDLYLDGTAPKLFGKVDGTPVTCLVDTGSTTSVLGRRIVPQSALTNDAVTVFTARGERRNQRFANVAIDFGDMVIDVEQGNVNDNSEGAQCIIGLSELRRYNATLVIRESAVFFEEGD